MRGVLTHKVGTYIEPWPCSNNKNTTHTQSKQPLNGPLWKKLITHFIIVFTYLPCGNNWGVREPVFRISKHTLMLHFTYIIHNIHYKIYFGSVCVSRWQLPRFCRGVVRCVLEGRCRNAPCWFEDGRVATARSRPLLGACAVRHPISRHPARTRPSFLVPKSCVVLSCILHLWLCLRYTQFL